MPLLHRAKDKEIKKSSKANTENEQSEKVPLMCEKKELHSMLGNLFNLKSKTQRSHDNMIAGLKQLEAIENQVPQAKRDSYNQQKNQIRQAINEVEKDMNEINAVEKFITNVCGEAVATSQPKIIKLQPKKSKK